MYITNFALCWSAKQEMVMVTFHVWMTVWCLHGFGNEACTLYVVDRPFGMYAVLSECSCIHRCIMQFAWFTITFVLLIIGLGDREPKPLCCGQPVVSFHQILSIAHLGFEGLALGQNFQDVLFAGSHKTTSLFRARVLLQRRFVGKMMTPF